MQFFFIYQTKKSLTRYLQSYFFVLFLKFTVNDKSSIRKELLIFIELTANIQMVHILQIFWLSVRYTLDLSASLVYRIRHRFIDHKPLYLSNLTNLRTWAPFPPTHPTNEDPRPPSLSWFFFQKCFLSVSYMSSFFRP